MSYELIIFLCTIFYVLFVQISTEFDFVKLCSSVNKKLGIKHFFLSFAEYNLISGDILPTNIAYDNKDDINTLFYNEFCDNLQIKKTYYLDINLNSRLASVLSCATIHTLKRNS